MSGQVTAIPCNCVAQNAPEGTDAHSEHTNECTFRPACVYDGCRGYGKPMAIGSDGSYYCEGE